MYSPVVHQNVQETPFGMDLCDLLQTLRLEGSKAATTSYPNSVSPTSISQDMQDDPMDEVNYHSDGGSDYSSSSSKSSANTNKDEAIINTTTSVTKPNEIYGCAYLKAIRNQLELYPTTGGEYLEAIMIHREILNSFPGAHQDCARAFTDLAYSLEHRAWRSDRDADMDAVIAFRHEAWVIASTMAPSVAPDAFVTTNYHPSTACVMPPMY